jgi:hypothetical protein
VALSGLGVPPPLETPTTLSSSQATIRLAVHTELKTLSGSDNVSATDMLEEKPSTISTAQLNALRRVHLPPIQPVVYRRSYLVNQ